MNQRAHVEVSDHPNGARYVRLAAGRANALSADLVDALHHELDRADLDGVRTLVLWGTERHFSAGFDLSRLDLETDSTLVYRFVRIGLLLERLTAAPFVTVAVVRGSAVGAGADLAAACDYRLGTPDAQLRFPGSAFGVVLGVSRLASLVGQAWALRLTTSGAVVDAREANTIGLLNAIHSKPGLDVAIEELVGAAACPPADTLPRLINAARPGNNGDALADLVRSVAQPGLSKRIAEFTAARASTAG